VAISNIELTFLLIADAITVMAATNRLDRKKWTAIRRVVMERDRGLCQIKILGYCTKIATEVDHIRPMSEGGEPYELSNLRAACRRCNRRLGGQLGIQRRAINERQRGWSRAW
jgi:5-methylcytosine-specific restriction endonuclease McrA